MGFNKLLSVVLILSSFGCTGSSHTGQPSPEASASTPSPSSSDPVSTRAPSPSSSDSFSTRALAGEVVGVHDGDSLTLLVGTTQHKIRLQGIDAPELGQPYGRKAKEALSAYTFGKSVRVKTHGEDRYRRVLGTVFASGVDINNMMVHAGLAWHYKKYSGSPRLSAAEALARSSKKGLWKGPVAIAPWDWRKGRRTTAPETGAETRTKDATGQYWLNTGSGVRHNTSCRYFQNTKRGRLSGPNEGKGCGRCGG